MSPGRKAAGIAIFLVVLPLVIWWINVVQRDKHSRPSESLAPNVEQATEQDDRSSSPESTSTAISSEDTSGWYVVHEYDFDWDGDGEKEHFLLEGSNEDEHEARLRIESFKKQLYEADFPGGWERNDAEYLGLESAGLVNLTDSPYLMFVRHGNSGNPPLLFLFGYAYASSPGRLRVLKLERGVPKSIFDMQEFDVAKFEDLDEDGYQDLIGRPCMSEGYGRYLSTYCPVNVYLLTGDGSRAEFSLQFSEQQTRARLNGWAGPGYSEKFAVVWRPDYNGTPKVMSRVEAEALVREERKARE